MPLKEDVRFWSLIGYKELYIKDSKLEMDKLFIIGYMRTDQPKLITISGNQKD